jgi:hypothetical protein
MTGKEKATAIAEYVARNFDYGYTASKGDSSDVKTVTIPASVESISEH